MSENPIEALGQIIGKIHEACDEKHGWIKDKEVVGWLRDNIANRMVLVQGQLGEHSGCPDSGRAGVDEHKDFVLFNKYRIQHADGTPVKGKSYFVLRLDSEKPDERARVSSAMNAYLGKSPDKAIEVLGRVHDWLGVVVRDGKCGDFCSVCIGASDLADDVWDVLHPEGVKKDEPAEKAPDSPQGSETSPAADKKDTDAKTECNGSELERRLRNIVVGQLGVSPEQVHLDSSFVDDLGADSLDCVELVMAAEEEFGFAIPEEDAEKLSTFGSALDYFKGRGL